MKLFGEPEGRKCFDILKGRLFPCDYCPTFRAMDDQMPRFNPWIKSGIKFRTVVTPVSEDLVNEVLIEIGSNSNQSLPEIIKGDCKTRPNRYQ